MSELNYGDKIFKLLQYIEKRKHVPDMHSFAAHIATGTVFVEARDDGIYVQHERCNGTWEGWVGTCIAAANRLELLDIDLDSVKI